MSGLCIILPFWGVPQILVELVRLHSMISSSCHSMSRIHPPAGTQCWCGSWIAVLCPQRVLYYIAFVSRRNYTLFFIKGEGVSSRLSGDFEWKLARFFRHYQETKHCVSNQTDPYEHGNMQTERIRLYPGMAIKYPLSMSRLYPSPFLTWYSK